MEEMVMPGPTQEHAWLQRMVGEWTYEGQCDMGPDQPPMKHTGAESVRAIGDLWVQGESTGAMPDGSPATMMLTMGYDGYRNRFVGTWYMSMMPFMCVYEGRLEGDTLTLETEMPDCMSSETPAKFARFRDVMELKSDDHRELRSYRLNDDGEWHQMVTMHYHRKK